MQSCWYLADQQFVGDAVSMNHRFSSAATVDLSIAFVEGRQPGPAFSRGSAIDFGPEPLSDRSWLNWHISSVAQHGSVYKGVG